MLLAIGVALAAPAAAVAAPAAGTGYHGVNGQFLWDPLIVGAEPAATAFRNAQLDSMRAEGLTLVRHGAPWSLMEAAGPIAGVHSYGWAYGDLVVRTLAARGLRWYPILGAPPLWASGSPASPPGCPGAFAAPAAARVGDFAAFARAFAERYGPDGRFWRDNPALTAMPVAQVELFNEPNMGCFFNTGGDDGPARYAALYGAARAAVRQASSSIALVAGGLANGADSAWTRTLAPATFVRRMFAARPALAGELDALGLHPYAPDAAQTFAQIAGLRAALDPLTPGRKVPIEVTEAGWFTEGAFPGDLWNFLPPIGESARATMLGTLAVELPASNCAVSRFIPHTWMSLESNPFYFHDWFGIVARNGVKKASALAFGAGVRASRVATPAPVLVHC